MGEFVTVASTAEIPPGQSKRVVVKGKEIAIFNTGEGYHATGDVCSHDEASLSEGELFGNVVECPLHGARFDVRTGKALSLPAVYPVPTYTLRVEDDAIKVEI
ncbi:MAG TPA: non-heme iron oxygenase ferredoxin subunit [Chloroflexota bacterium]|nr:non-heme iron oxygenase ferredoxin subunit [Chloroflexota bacterium]